MWARPVASAEVAADAAPVAIALPPVVVDAPAPLTRRSSRVRTASADVATDAADASPSGPEPAVAFLIAAAEAAAEAPVVVAEPVAEAQPVEAEPVELVATPGEPASEAVFELLEPEVVAEPEPEPIPEPVASAAVDEFEAAARLFSFTGETPIQKPAAESAVADDVPTASAHVAAKGRGRRARSGSSFKRVAAASFSMGAMTIAGLLAVGMTTPAAAVAASTPSIDNPAATSVLTLAGDVDVQGDDIQAYVAPAEVENEQLDREGGYSIASLADIAKADGINHTSSFFTNDPTAAIQWPFPVGVPMSFGFGMRWGAMHTGIDLTPGNGAKIQAIADGVVRSASDATGGYGVNIYIDHVIDGKLVTSHYAHMQYGSMRVKAGDHVKVGQIIGVVGNTGHSFGAHLHFEILLNGTQLVDPLPWMRKNAGRHSLG